MVLIDTNIWISLYRKRDSELGQKMWALTARNEAALCGQVWVEYVGGFRREKERLIHSQALQAFPFIETTFKAFQLAAELLAKHPRLGAGDAIIAATALDQGLPLLTLDKDFSCLAEAGLILF